MGIPREGYVEFNQINKEKPQNKILFIENTMKKTAENR